MADELSYLRSRIDELTGQVIRSDSVVSRAKRELGQRRKALSILSDLQRTVRADMPEAEVARIALSATAQGLKMDRSVLLTHERDGVFVATAAVGYASNEDPALAGTRLTLPDQLTESGARLVTATTPPDGTVSLIRERLHLPHFVTAPVIAGTRPAGLIVSGRIREQKPFFPPLDEGDLATWQATAGFLGSAILNGELFARVKRMADSFARFVPREFLDLLGRDDMVNVQIGDQTRLELSILFSDIRGFTSLSEKMTPEETFRFVNGYLAHAAPVIRRHGGFIDKYIGDAIMAIFPHSPADAVAAGIELQQAVGSFNASLLATGLHGVAVGVGVHTGQVMLGTTGFEDRLDCTVIADAVNLASRLEGLTKYYGSALIISGEVCAKLTAPPEHRLVDRVRVKGKRDPVAVIDVFAADAEEMRALKRQTLPEFTAGLSEYTTGRLDAADVLFASVLERNPNDLAASLLASRVKHFRDHDLPPDWAGVVSLDAK